MPSILIATVPIYGHVVPLLAAARHFAQRGDRVRFVTGARFAEAVRATGAEHHPLPAEIDFDDRQDWDEVFPARAELKGTRALAHDLENIFIRPGPAQCETVWALHADEPADVVITDPAFTGGAYLLGYPDRERPPIVMGGICPLMITSRDTAPYGLGLTPMAGPIGRLRNSVLGMITNRLVLSGAQRIAERAFVQLHGRSIPFPVLDWPRHADAIAQFTVPEFEYPRSDAPATLHFTGPISVSGSTAPLPPWWSDLDGPRPVVHLTQGTIANLDFGQLIGPALEALADEDVMIAVATGGRPVDSLPPLPANARAADFLPYDALLPKTAVYVTNGGYGGVQYALWHGVPIVAAAGSHEDKPEVLARIAWSGVGRRIGTDIPKPAAIRRAVRDVLDDHRYREAAARVAERMRTTTGVHRLSEIVDGLIADRALRGLRDRGPN